MILRQTKSRAFQIVVLVVIGTIMPGTAAAAAVESWSGQTALFSGSLTVLSALLGLIAGVLALRNEKLKSSNGALNEQIARLRAFAQQMSDVRYIITDVFFLGARGHGKTSIVTTLTKEWKAVHNLRPTATDFVEYVWTSPNYVYTRFNDQNLGVERHLATTARLKIFDYAGEDSSVDNALRNIGQSEKYIMVFIISSEDTPSVQCGNYFNVAMLKRMKNAIATARSDPLNVLILFTKHDLANLSPQLDPEDVCNDIIQKHRLVIENIESVFGATQRIMVSATTGFGVTVAVRHILSKVVDDGGLPR